MALVTESQEFIEVHLDLPNSFTLDEVEEFRESPDEVVGDSRHSRGTAR